MKCGCYVKEILTHGGKRSRMDVYSWFHTTENMIRVYDGLKAKPDHTNTRSVENLLANGYSICGGKVMASVEATDEPYYGGSSAVLEVGYECQRCSNRFWPELPDSGRINEFLTKFIEEMDEATLRDAAIQREHDSNAAREEMMARYKIQQAEQAAIAAARKAAREAKKKPR